jgi:Ca2+-binding RTX toxin-like protein
LSNIEVIQLAGTADQGNANFQAADMSGQTFTMKSDGGQDDNGFTVTAAATTTVIDLSTLTIDTTISKAVDMVAITASAASQGVAITGTAIDDTITGSSYADTITGGNGIDIIIGGDGNDTIILTETTANSAVDQVNLAVASSNGKDTITGFKVGTDNILLNDSATDSTDATMALAAVAVSLVTGASAYDISGSITMAGGSDHHAAEITVTLSANGDLDASDNGSELLKALSTSATAAASQITVDNAADGYLIAYQDGKAYLYEFGTTDTTVVASDISLVAVLEGITAGALTAGDFLIS